VNPGLNGRAVELGGGGINYELRILVLAFPFSLRYDATGRPRRFYFGSRIKSGMTGFACFVKSCVSRYSESLRSRASVCGAVWMRLIVFSCAFWGGLV